MQQLVTVNFQLSPQVRRNTRDGHEYLVAPVVAVKEGVLNGELLLAKDIALSAPLWNSIPLPIDHPFENGLPISVNRADLLNKCVGHFENVRFEDNALKGELWVNVGKTNTVGGHAITARQRLEGNLPLEVSTAYRCDIEPASGEYNGLAYNGIQRNLRPDHLALLPHKKGACSWEHGCGAPRHNEDKPAMTFLQKLKEKLFGDDFRANVDKAFAEVEQEVPLDLSAQPETTDDRPKIYNNTVHDNSGAGIQVSTPQEPTIQGNTLYLPGGTYTGNQLKPLFDQLKTNCDCPDSEQHVNTQEVHMDKKELVTNVLRVQKRPESERAAFEALPEETLKVLSAEPAAEPEPKKAEPVAAAPAAQPDIAAIVQMAVKEALANVPTVNADAQHFFKQVEAKATEHRGKLSEFIKANSAYTDEELSKKDVGELEKIVSLIRPQANYGGRLMPSMAANEKKTGVPKLPPLVEPKAAA